MSKIKFIKVRDVKSPERANLTDSGIDLYIPDDLEEIKRTPLDLQLGVEYKKDGKFEIKPGQGLLIPSGIKMIIPELYEVALYNKSGISTKYGLVVGACIIDNGYIGETHIHLINTSNEILYVFPGQKIIQGIIRKIENWVPELISEEEFNELAKQKERGSNGFGSSGEK